MDTINYISNKQLPLHLDFKSLKKEALDFIHNHIGSQWTNFNPSDPGVTILDQYCYALTELGYCTDFSIEDILTNTNGKIEIENQFYLPYEILTTAPFTINDYKKYLIDGIKNIENACIQPFRNNSYPFNKVYQVYLYVNPLIEAIEQLTVCKSTFYYLNKSRNIGEVFNEPIVLQPNICWIGGKIVLENETNLPTILKELNDKICNYIFPKVTQTSYKKLTDLGYTSAEIYDGPYLKNGAILSEALFNKKDSVKITDLIPILESVNGIVSFSELQLYQNGNSVSALESSLDQILTINCNDSYKNKTLLLSCNGKELPYDTFESLPSNNLALPSITENISNETKFQFPKSNFRDINTYYSIQNTFPEQYNIGEDTIEVNSSQIQKAQSRQLKGYLTLFDQVIANQFSQLANVSKLFSFKNSVCGDPSDEEAFYAVKNKYEQSHLEYPVPYKKFSPSYYYQSLYSIPHIKPLLKNNTTFNYSNTIQSSQELEEQSWIEYQQDPFNPYIFGLMNIMEEDKTSFKRRNKLLDHLLARHGESPLVIDSIIAGTTYTGDKTKDQLIVKSVYLQNLGLLSYNRQKGYNCIGASKIADTIDGKTNTELPIVTEENLRLLSDNATDFIFKSEEFNKKEKLTKQDFNDFSALELKMNLLFGLRNQYLNFISDQLDSLKNNPEIISKPEIILKNQQALWLTQKRRGLILIEPVLLLNQLMFDLTIIKKNQTDYTTYTFENLDSATISNLNNVLNTENQIALDSQLQKGSLTYSLKNYTCKTTNITLEHQDDFIKTKNSDYLYGITIWSRNDKIKLDEKIFGTNIFLIFPDFIPQFQTAEFQNRLQLFLKNSLPVSIKYESLFLNSQQLEVIIPNYITWYESLRHKNETTSIDNTDSEIITKNAFPADSFTTTMNLINSLIATFEP